MGVERGGCKKVPRLDFNGANGFAFYEASNVFPSN